MNEKQPMTTAPKDGKPFLAYAKEGLGRFSPCFSIVYYVGVEEIGQFKKIHIPVYEDCEGDRGPWDGWWPLPTP